MKFVLEINCDNAAFEGEPLREVSRILRNEAAKIAHWVGDGSRQWDSTLMDENGNKVGKSEMVHE